MAIEVKIPSVGESVQEGLLAEWFKRDGEVVDKDEALFVIETDKVTLEVNAESSGTLSIKVPAGETVRVGDVVASIEEGAASRAGAPSAGAPRAETSRAESPRAESPPAGAPETHAPAADKAAAEPRKAKTEGAARRPEPPAAAPTAAVSRPEAAAAAGQPPLPPSMRRLAFEKKIDLSRIRGSGPQGRLTPADVLLRLQAAPAGVPGERQAPAAAEPAPQRAPAEVRKRMSPIRKRIAARLLEARRNTAMLTTFNDIDMGSCMELRSRYKQDFKEKHDVALGFMSFFVKASVAALAEFPEINAFIDGEEIVYHNHQHIGMAIGSGKGLVVPVIRNAEQLSFAQIEKAIIDYVDKVGRNRLELADLEGGTFTITNGGIFGSLLSTPILNTPQSGILGLHRIEKRAVVIEDQIVIRPMMYVALSYDHRIVDGREAVTFLKRVKELIESPERLLLEV